MKTKTQLAIPLASNPSLKRSANATITSNWFGGCQSESCTAALALYAEMCIKSLMYSYQLWAVATLSELSVIGKFIPMC